MTVLVLVLMWSDPHAVSIPSPFSTCAPMSSFSPSLRTHIGWICGRTGHKQTMCEARLGRGPETLCLLLSRNHVTNAPRKIFLGGHCDTEEPPLWHRGATMYSRFISAVSAARQPSLIREMTQVINIFNFYHFHFSHTPQTILSVRFLRLLRQRWSLCLEDSQTPRCSLSSSSPLKSREEIKSSFRERVCRWKIFPYHQPAKPRQPWNNKKPRPPCNTSPPRATLACFTNCVNCRKKPTHLTRWQRNINIIETLYT